MVGTIQVGQRVYSGLYGGRNGIVFAISGDQSPQSVQHFGGVCTGGRAYLDVVFDNGTISRKIPEAIVRGVQWRILDEVATPSEIVAAIHNAEQSEARRQAEAEATAARHAREREQHERDYPHLLKKTDRPTWTRGRLAAENIRRELKRAFPKTKFKVTSDHNSVSVHWTCGPVAKDVEAIANRYKAGSFNGMTDSYESDPDATFADVFGDPSYVFCTRDYPRDGLERCWRQIAEFYGVAYDGPNTRTDSGRDVTELVYRILQHSPLGDTLSGLERVEGVTCGLAEEFWRAV